MMKSKLLNRIIVSLIFGPVTLLLFWLGGIALQIFLGILTFGMLFEIRKSHNDKGLRIPFMQMILGEIVYLALVLGNSIHFIGAIFLTFVILGGMHIFRNDVQGAIHRIAVSIFSIVYISIFISMIYSLRNLPQGREVVISLLFTVWITDTFAYFTGMLIGKHQGIIAISPNKSLEGFIGGLVFSIIGSYFLVRIFGLSAQMIWMLPVAGGLIGQFGDLFESLIKRDLQIKDSSRILFEHGGVLDRFDSLLFSAPALYILYILLGV